jgi:spore coat protein U-like protein
LNYNLYTTSARTTVWGDGSSSTGTVSDSYLLGLGAGTSTDYTVWGRIPMQQNVPTGTYNDSVVLTVEY